MLKRVSVDTILVMSKYQGVKTLEVLEGADNYNRWIADKIRPYINGKALELGAGTGNISAYFKGNSSITLSDNDSGLVKLLREKFANLKNINFEVLDIEKRFLSTKYTTVFSVNVFEHIKNDLVALKNVNAMLKTGGKIVMLVPAKRFAFNNLDKELGHYRRYEKKELEEKLQKAGFEVEKIQFFNILGLLSWIVRDKISRNDTHLKPYQVKLFDSIVPILKRVERLVTLPIGISLITIARKK